MENPVPTFEISESDLLRVAHLEISDSVYAQDISALNGFALGLGLSSRCRLRDWLQCQLGDKFPTELPDNWIYARGL